MQAEEKIQMIKEAIEESKFIDLSTKQIMNQTGLSRGQTISAISASDEIIRSRKDQAVFYGLRDDLK